MYFFASSPDAAQTLRACATTAIGLRGRDVFWCAIYYIRTRTYTAQWACSTTDAGEGAWRLNWGIAESCWPDAYRSRYS
jgi:hypothetical protein